MKQSNGSACGHGSAGVSAVVFLYKLCGSSQPSIIQASDGAFYVVKFNGFPGSQGLVNEVVGAQLFRLLGLPSPHWTLIEASSDFIEQNQGAWFCRESLMRPHSGLHFGSRLIEAPGDQRTYQMIPHSWIERIENRADFLGALILDLWTNACDRRQAVFLSDVRGRLHASFIDNDHMFGGKFGNDNGCPRRVMVYDLDVYRGLWNPKSVTKWLHRIDGIDENAIRKIVANVPEEWANQEARLHIVDQLRARRSILPRLVNDAREIASSGYSVQYHRARNATEPSQFRNASLFPASR